MNILNEFDVQKKLYKLKKYLPQNILEDLASFWTPIFATGIMEGMGCPNELVEVINTLIKWADIAFSNYRDDEGKTSFLRDRLKEDNEELRQKIEEYCTINHESFNSINIDLLSKATYSCIDALYKNIDYTKPDNDITIDDIVNGYIESNKYDDYENTNKEFLKNNLKKFFLLIVEAIEVDENNPIKQVKFNLMTIEKLNAMMKIVKESDIASKTLRKDIPTIKNERKQFKDYWNEPLFLDKYKNSKNRNEKTSNNKLQVLLSDVYITPNYYDSYDSYRTKEGYFENIHNYFNKWFKRESIDFRNSEGNHKYYASKMLAVFGEPGIGKSSFITYILNNFDIGKEIRLRVNSLKNIDGVDWGNISIKNIPEAILKALDLNQTTLSNTILILDGLDEINLNNKQAEFLAELNNQWINENENENFRLIITCRTNRINDFDLLEDVPYIILSPFSMEQIERFTLDYEKKRKDINRPLKAGSLTMIKDLFDNDEESDDKHIKGGQKIFEVLQIPILLYMILGLNLDINKDSTLTNLYTQIFSIDGKNSIYNHDSYSHDIHNRTSGENSKYIHEFSKEVAVNMWMKNPSRAALERNDYMKISEYIIKKLKKKGEGNEKKTSINNINDLLTGQYFVEGVNGDELYFVHRSMYEFFTAISIYDALTALFIDENSHADIENAEAEDILYYEDSEESNETVGFSLTNSNKTYFKNLLRLLGIKNLLTDENLDIRKYFIEILEEKSSELKVSEKWWQTLFSEFNKQPPLNFYSPNCYDKKSVLMSDAIQFYNLVYVAKETLNAANIHSPFKLFDNKELDFYNRINIWPKDLSKIKIK